MRQVPPKHRFLQEPHGVTSEKTLFFIVTAVKTSNLTQPFLSHGLFRRLRHICSPLVWFPVANPLQNEVASLAFNPKNSRTSSLHWCPPAWRWPNYVPKYGATFLSPLCLAGLRCIYYNSRQLRKNRNMHHKNRTWVSMCSLSVELVFVEVRWDYWRVNSVNLFLKADRWQQKARFNFMEIHWYYTFN
jgi:hypothetical protein